jgi:PST family polysaccharide transporter
MYDYLVVAGMTGSIMTTQISWLIALIPALLLGAAGGIAGVAAAQLVVVAAVVLPAYLWRLNAAGLSPRKVGRQVWLPTVCSAAIMALSALLQDKGLPFPAGLIISSFAALGAAGSMLWLRRADVATLRQMGRSGGLDQH